MSESVPTSAPVKPPNQETRGRGDRFFRSLCLFAGLMILLIMAGLVVTLVYQSKSVLLHAGEYEFFTSSNWNPKPAGDQPITLGSLAFIYGTLATSLIALLIAVPLGVFSAAFLAEISTGLVRRVGAFFIELLAAIPSVVYGFFGVQVLAPKVQWVITQFGGPNNSGSGILSAGIILAIMVLPYITAITFDVCRAVPSSQRQASLALGATRWQMIWSAVLPYARPGIIAACFLAFGRALGETMAVTMLIGNKAQIPDSFSEIIFGLGDSIASVIANQLAETDNDLQRSALVGLGLVLLVVTGIMNILARYLINRMGRVKTPLSVTQAPVIPDDPKDRIIPPIPKHPLPTNRVAPWTNLLMTWVLRISFFTTVIPLFVILSNVAIRGFSAINPNLFLETPGGANDPDTGVGHAMLGSLIMVFFATMFAVPIGLLSAIYLTETKNSRLTKIVRFCTELLGGVPSIVIGIYIGAICFVIFGSFSGWAGSIALAIMMIPIVVRSAEESIKLVPDSLRQASYALGASQVQTVLRVVLPAALPAIMTGVFLAIGRIAGETAPLLLTANNFNFWPESMAKSFPFLPYYIYDGSRSAYPILQNQAWGAALVLLCFIMALNIGIRVLAGKRMITASRAD
jgi:phosphate transport system permease protein